jgi:hypothetical protein
MNRFINNTLNPEIDYAIQIANSLLNEDSPMIKAVLNKTDWKYNSGTPTAIAHKLLEARNPINIYAYADYNTKAIGYFDGKNIYVNTAKGIKGIDLVGILIHEYSHYCGFNHGTGWFRNYKTKAKCLYSVPYYLSENIYLWV